MTWRTTDVTTPAPFTATPRQRCLASAATLPSGSGNLGARNVLCISRQTIFHPSFEDTAWTKLFEASQTYSFNSWLQVTVFIFVNHRWNKSWSVSRPPWQRLMSARGWDDYRSTIRIPLRKVSQATGADASLPHPLLPGELLPRRVEGRRSDESRIYKVKMKEGTLNAKKMYWAKRKKIKTDQPYSKSNISKSISRTFSYLYKPVSETLNYLQCILFMIFISSFLTVVSFVTNGVLVLHTPVVHSLVLNVSCDEQLRTYQIFWFVFCPDEAENTWDSQCPFMQVWVRDSSETWSKRV